MRRRNAAVEVIAVALESFPANSCPVSRSEVMVDLDQPIPGDVVLDRQIVKVVLEGSVARTGVVVRLELRIELSDRQTSRIQTVHGNDVARKRTVGSLRLTVNGIHHRRNRRGRVINDKRLKALARTGAQALAIGGRV